MSANSMVYFLVSWIELNPIFHQSHFEFKLSSIISLTTFGFVVSAPVVDIRGEEVTHYFHDKGLHELFCRRSACR